MQCECHTHTYTHTEDHSLSLKTNTHKMYIQKDTINYHIFNLFNPTDTKQYFSDRQVMANVQQCIISNHSSCLKYFVHKLFLWGKCTSMSSLLRATEISLTYKLFYFLFYFQFTTSDIT